ncbi:MAG: TonB-dependent receptor [Verrucomicrobia bacterium]|nr:TonB-dependent receptor [Verrucomicrobiota bacterium]
MEFEALYSLLPNWSILGSYAYTDTKVRRDPENPFFEGLRMQFVPLHKVALFTKYEVREGVLNGLNLRGGFVHFSERYLNTRDLVNDANNRIRLPSEWILEAGVGYGRQIGKTWWNFDISVKNLTDENFVGGYGAGDFVAPYWAPPREWRFTLSANF